MNYLTYLPAIVAIIGFALAAIFAKRLSSEKRAKLVAFCCGMVVAQVLMTVSKALVP